MHIRNIIFSLILISLNNICIYGQYPEKVEQISVFSSKINNPIKIEVKKKGDSFQFYARNRSFYSYRIKLDFQEIYNLIPILAYREFEVPPGTNYLFSLNLEDNDRIPNYRYSVSYSIGVPGKKVEKEYPYLIPLSTYNSFKLFASIDDSNIFFKDHFKINVGDTVLSMRKGYVAAVPDMYHDADRISRHESLEIIHEDGTIMIYENIKPDSVFVEPGSTVYPAQPLGIINEELFLIVYLYMIRKDGKLEKMNINYYISEDRIELFSKNMENTAIKHPVEIITKEMTRREIKKIDKTDIIKH